MAVLDSTLLFIMFASTLISMRICVFTQIKYKEAIKMNLVAYKKQKKFSIPNAIKLLWVLDFITLPSTSEWLNYHSQLTDFQHLWARESKFWAACYGKGSNKT